MLYLVLIGALLLAVGICVYSTSAVARSFNPLQPLFPGKPLPDARVQKKVYDLVHFIEPVLEAHGIRFFMYAGALLGAVRHGGLIPWDDDADYVIFEEDLPKLLALGPRLAAAGVTLRKTKSGAKMGYAGSGPLGTLYPHIDFDVVLQHGSTLVVTGCPGEYFDIKDVFPVKKYKFGPTHITGPQHCEPYFLNYFGPAWATHARIKRRGIYAVYPHPPSKFRAFKLNPDQYVPAIYIN